VLMMNECDYCDIICSLTKKCEKKHVEQSGSKAETDII